MTLDCMLRSLLVLVMLSTVGAAEPCKRPAFLPAEIPLLACPTKASESGCRGCLENQRNFLLEYAGTTKAIADGWTKELRAAGWTVDATTTIRATKGKATLFGELHRGGSGVMLFVSFVP